jgi:hypothetical protein
MTQKQFENLSDIRQEQHIIETTFSLLSAIHEDMKNDVGILQDNDILLCIKSIGNALTKVAACDDLNKTFKDLNNFKLK